MFKLLTGKPPFEGQGSGDVIAAHLREPPPFAAALVPDLPDMVDLILQRCLQKDPATRFQNMIELAQALGQVEDMLHHSSQPTIAVEGSAPVPGTWPTGQPVSSILPLPAAAPSTITHASGERPRRPRSRAPIIIAATATTLVVAIVATQFATRRGASSAAPPRADAAVPRADALVPLATPPVDAAPTSDAASADASMPSIASPADAGHAAPPEAVQRPIDAGKIDAPPGKSGHRVGKPTHANPPSAGDFDRGD
jgi:hypothetical protein